MRGSTTVYVAHGHYLIKPYEALPALLGSDDDSTILLHTAAPGEGAHVLPGTFDGEVELRVESGSDLSEQDPADWEVVEDIEVVVEARDLVVVSELDVYDDIPPVPITPGPVALRLLARGVAEARETRVFGPDGIPVGHLQLGEDGRHVVAHRLRREREPLRDRTVGQPGGDQRQHLPLPAEKATGAM